MRCGKGLDLYTLVVAIRFGYNNTEKEILLGGICMWSYLNPGTKGFQESLNSKIYVDKTGLIEKTNAVLNTRQKFLCVSRPRRFGKSMAADMLAAGIVKAHEEFQSFVIACWQRGCRYTCVIEAIQKQ